MFRWIKELFECNHYFVPLGWSFRDGNEYYYSKCIKCGESKEDFKCKTKKISTKNQKLS